MKEGKHALAVALAMLLFPMTALAQEYVSVAEVYEQAQAMGGVWQETFETPFGQLTVDAPVIVPDAQTMPVLTMEYAKISEELFNAICQGQKVGSRGDHDYEVEINGETVGFFLGRDNDYVYGEQTDKTGYDAVSTVWMYHGGYLESLQTGMGTAEKRAEPTSLLTPGEFDPDAPCVRNSDITLNEAMRLWREDIALAYPDEEFTIRPTKVKLRGSIVEPSFNKENKRDGYLVIEGAEQLVGGFPLMGAIGGNFSIPYGTTAEMNRESDRLNIYRIGCDSVTNCHFYGNFTDKDNYRTSGTLARTRTVEYEDVPLAPLERVLESVRREIVAGNIRHIYSIELGYILYSNPDMTDYAWAIPRWKVEADYVTKDMEWTYRNITEPEMWGSSCIACLPADAQSGELIIFTVGDAETFSVPDMVTWEETCASTMEAER